MEKVDGLDLVLMFSFEYCILFILYIIVGLSETQEPQGHSWVNIQTVCSNRWRHKQIQSCLLGFYLIKVFGSWLAT